jgi:8-oxo-dGTP pyrophosphatase MutT (NUDIX family)
MAASIDVTVAAIIEQDKEFLIVEERVGEQIVFNQPAGHLEPGESLLDAVVRETREETGFAFSPESVVGVYLWYCQDAGRSFLRVTFSGNASAPTKAPPLDDGIVAVHWLSRRQLANRRHLLRSPLVMRVIDDYSSGVRHPLSCLSYIDPDLDTRAKLA